MEIHNIKQEGEVFSSDARIQFAFLSYMKIVLIMAFAWALLDLIFGLFTVHVAQGQEETGFLVYGWAAFMYVGWGFSKALLGGVISYPIYKWWCQRNRGQRMTGRFALIVTP